MERIRSNAKQLEVPAAARQISHGRPISPRIEDLSMLLLMYVHRDLHRDLFAIIQARETVDRRCRKV